MNYLLGMENGGDSVQVIKGKSTFLISTFTDYFEQRLASARARSRSFSVFLSGGNSPIPLYHSLAEKVSHWDNVKLFLGDERAVAFTDPQSNRGMINRELISKISIDESAISFPQISDDLAADCQNYEAVLRNYLKENDQFDLAIVGLGNDGHTLSLFPDSPECHIKDLLYTPVPRLPVPRVSGTFALLAHCREIAVFAPGKEKFRVFKRLLDASESEHLPAASLQQFSTRWYLSDE